MIVYPSDRRSFHTSLVGDLTQTTACSSLHENQDAMIGETVQQKVLITSPQGFHLRPAGAFVELAKRFQSTVTVSNKDGRRVDGKSSPLELLFLGALQGSELTLEISGPDANEALNALTELLATSSLEDEAEQPPVPQKG